MSEDATCYGVRILAQTVKLKSKNHFECVSNMLNSGY